MIDSISRHCSFIDMLIETTLPPRPITNLQESFEEFKVLRIGCLEIVWNDRVRCTLRPGRHLGPSARTPTRDKTPTSSMHKLTPRSSTNETGHAVEGGDEVLERVLGDPEGAAVVSD